MPHHQLTVDDLYQTCPVEGMEFTTTAELEPLHAPPGQRRARDAIEFGVDVDKDGFNIFALGAHGVGKMTLVRSILDQRRSNGRPQHDWCYVSNFEDPQKPRLLRLDTGLGCQLKADMQQLVEDLLTALPSSFEDEEFQRRRQEVEEEISERYEQSFKALTQSAQERGIALLRTPVGYTLAPLKDGKIVTPEEFAKLSSAEQERLQSVIAELQSELEEAVNKLPMLKREAAHRVKELVQEVTEFTVGQFVAWLENKYHEHPAILEYLQGVKDYAIENAEDFLPEGGSAEVTHLRQRVRSYSTFQVNVIVDNKDATGEPVIFEENPTYQNLVGRVEYVSQMGTLLTDFTLIRAGALHRANGGYLILEADKLLRHMYAWEGLKQALKSNEIKIASLQELLSLSSVISLEPESVPLKVKVILIGEPILYYLLNHYDPDFGEIFRVAADFAVDTERNDENQLLYARMIASIQRRNELLPLERSAVGRLIEHAARLADDAEKMSMDQDKLCNLLESADYWARKAASEHILIEHIQTAIDREIDRHNQLSERLGEQILRGIKLIDTEGSKVAQINGLSVLRLDSYSFGLPSRITATARMGRGDVIDIEREAKLGGDIHSKGVLILSSFLAQAYAAERPLPLSASLVFEQSYGGVDGDSASCAELCVLLSAIAQIPLRQDLAVTGSMNQLGEVQAIGGINEKIEGFFDICKGRGLTGSQGVIMPAANKTHLMLRKDVRDAVAAGQFQIYTVNHVADVMSLLCGLPAGESDKQGVYPEGTFNRLICDRIEKLLELRKSFAGRGDEKDER